jgi:hypothetical protein
MASLISKHLHATLHGVAGRDGVIPALELRMAAQSMP